MPSLSEATAPPQTRFGSVLARLRKEQGFATAHAFYKARGGRRVFGVAFTNYLALERGNSLPKGRRLEGLVAALGLEPGSRAARELVLAFLKDTLGSETLARPFEVPPCPIRPPRDGRLRKMRRGRPWGIVAAA